MAYPLARRLVLAALVLGGAACASTRPAPPPAIPVVPAAVGTAAVTGTWVLVELDGHPVPATIQLDATFRVLLVDRKLVLAGDGTFRQAGEGLLEAGRRPIARLPEVAGRWTARDAVVSFIPAGGEVVVARREGATLSYRDGEHAWSWQRCSAPVVGATCRECHRTVDATDPATTTTHRFAAACSDADDEHP